MPPKRPDAGRHSRAEMPRYNQELRRAKNAGLRIKFHLALETGFTDEDCTVEGSVLEVDKFSVKIKTNLHGTEREFWIANTFIVSTEILA